MSVENMARILAVDYGERRLGFAVSDPLESIAFPLRVETVGGRTEGEARIRAVYAETGAERLVIGLPVNMNGSHGPMAEAVSAVADRLREALKAPVDTYDERMTTQAVDRLLIGEADMSRRRRREVRDKLAAQQILQSYLDSRPREDSPHGGDGD
jgi:putative Holliday junction resolvase